MEPNRGVLALIPLAVTAVLACASLAPSRVEQSDAGVRRSLSRVAVAPVTFAPALERRGAKDSTLYAEAATHVGHYLAEALLERGVEVVTAEDSRIALADLTRSPEFHRDATRLARAASLQLGVDSLLVIELTQWSPRDALRSRPLPTAVGFRATLHGGSDGLLLWSGQFSERQVSFFESPWRSLQYPGMGTRWLSPTELARWGARRLAAEIPVGSRQ